MKDKIFIFIIGLLIGAVITAAGFLAFEKTHKNTNFMPGDGRMQMMERPEGEPPEGMPERNEEDGTRPEKPDEKLEEKTEDTSKEKTKTM